MRPSPSVLRLITRLNIGGPAIQALLLTTALRESYPTILAAGTPPPEEGELRDPEVDVVRVPLVRPVSPLADVSAYRSVRRLIANPRISLIHTHMAKAGIIGRVAARGRHIKTVHTFHGHVLEGYFASPVQKAFIALERSVGRRTDALVAVSEEVRDSLLALGIGSPERFHVIPLGFDLSPFLSVSGRTGALRRTLRLPPDVPLIGIAGRLAAIKDHATLLRAMRGLPDAHLAILGDGEKRSDVEAAIKDFGLEQRVHMVGWRLDMAECIADTDVVVLTSRNEGTPVSLIEASASARPVVATDVGGVRSVVVDGITGFLVDAGDDVAVSRRLRTLIDDRALSRRLGEAGREHVVKQFDQVRLINEVKDLYDSLLAHSA